MRTTLAILVLLIALGTGLTNSAFAHKSEVVGDYLVDISWKNEPPIVGVVNTIVLEITTATMQDKTNSKQMTDSMDTSMSHDTMSHDTMSHDTMSHDTMSHDTMSHDTMSHDTMSHDTMSHDTMSHDTMSHDTMSHDTMSHDANSGMNHAGASHDMVADNIPKDSSQNGVTGLASNLDVTITLGEKKVTLEMIEDPQNPGKYYSEFTPQIIGHPAVHVFTAIKGDPIEVTFHPEQVRDGASMDVSSSDGTVNLNIITTAPLKDQEMSVKLSFTDSQGNNIDHVNYDIIATQKQQTVLVQTGLHSHTGVDEQLTSVLSSDDPVDIQVKLLGIGKPDEKANWSGPVEELAPIHVTPEFGPIVFVMLGIGVFATIGLSLRTKL